MLARVGQKAVELLTAILLLIGLAAPSSAAQLVVDVGAPHTFDTATLLARPDVASITVPMDATYKQAVTYRAVPLRALMGVSSLPDGKVLQVVSADGFVTDLPSALLFSPGRRGATPWLAIEPPDAPWPAAPNGDATGPFYLVWLDPEASGVLQEQWPYAVTRLQLADAPAVRWPQIAVGEEAPADSAVRKGEKLVGSQCMVCHTVDGAGDARIGPDLIRPYSPTEYFQPWAFRALIRDPAALRDWPGRRMPSFSKDVLSDDDIAAIAAFLNYLAGRRK